VPVPSKAPMHRGDNSMSDPAAARTQKIRWRLPFCHQGTPSFHPSLMGVSIINHPTIGVPPFMETIGNP
jgi:hypothetical protein